MSESHRVRPGPRRWERVAQSYFRAPPSLGYRVGIAGPGPREGLRGPLAEVQEAASELDGQGHAGIQIHDLGTVDEARLTRLAGEIPEALDLLIWVDVAEGHPSERSGYLLGIFAWATEASAVTCLVSPGFRPEDTLPLEQGVSCAGLHQVLAFQCAATGSGPEKRRWWCGLLQGAMAREDARRRQRSVAQAG